MGIFDGALSYLFGNGDTTQQTKPAPTQNLAGVGQPVNSLYGNIAYPDFQKYVSDQQGTRGVLSTMLAKGIGPGLGQAIAPESSFMPNYIAGLEGAQKAYATGLGFPKMEVLADYYAHPEKYMGQGGVAAPTPTPAAQLPPPSDGQSWGGAAPTAGGLFSAPQSPGLLGNQPQAQSPQAAPMGAPGTPAAAGGGNSLFGVPLPPNLSPRGVMVGTLAQPDLFKSYFQGMYGDHRSGSYGINPATGQPDFFAPSIPGVSTASGMPGTPGYEARSLGYHAQQQQDIADAQLGKDTTLRGLDYLLRTGQKPPGGWLGGGGGGGNTGGNLPPSPAPRGGPQAMPAPAGPQAGPQQMPNGDIQTERGTVVPNPRVQTQSEGEDRVKADIANSQKTEENWNAVRPSIDQTRVNLASLARAFSGLQTGGLTTGKAEAANALRGVPGMGWLADNIMSAKDTAEVQKALWFGMQDVLKQLKVINSGTGGRILNSEFNAFLENGFSPNMMGPALHSAITQQMGQTYQVQNMIDDYYGSGKQAGWRDANQFQSQYLKRNPLENFVGYAENDVPQFGRKPQTRVEMNIPKSGSNLTPGTSIVNGRTYKWVE